MKRVTKAIHGVVLAAAVLIPGAPAAFAQHEGHQMDQMDHMTPAAKPAVKARKPAAKRRAPARTRRAAPGASHARPAQAAPTQPEPGSGTEHDTMPGMQHEDMQHDSMPGMHHENAPSTQQESMPGMQHGDMPGMQHGGMPGMQHGGMQMSEPLDVPELAPLAGAEEEAEPEPSGPAIRLADLEQKAAAVSPALAEAQAAVEVARGRARQAGLYPNPTVGYSGEEIKNSPVIRGGEHGFFVDQTIVLGGKLGKRRDVLLGAVKEAEAALETTRFGVLTSVRFAFFEALAARQRVELERREVALLREAVRTSYGLFNAGQSDKPDVLEIEIEQRQAEVGLIEARTALEQARSQLAIAVGDPGMAIGPLEGRLEDALPAGGPARLEDIIAKSPLLATARAGVERAEAGVRAARAERIPNLSVRGGMRYNRELLEANNRAVGWEGFAEAGIGIPIFDRNQGGIAAAEAELRIAEAEVKRVELGVRSRYATVFARYRDAERVSEAYRRDIIPRAATAYNLYLAKYKEMAAAYPQVLIARKTWIQANKDYIRALEQLYRAALPLQGLLVGDMMDGSGGGRLDQLALPGGGRDSAEDRR